MSENGKKYGCTFTVIGDVVFKNVLRIFSRQPAIFNKVETAYPGTVKFAGIGSHCKLLVDPCRRVSCSKFQYRLFFVASVLVLIRCSVMIFAGGLAHLPKIMDYENFDRQLNTLSSYCMAVCKTSAICWQYFSVNSILGPSTITRHRFCVPE